MHSLADLKALFIANGIPITKSVGYSFNVKKDIWTMLADEYYCNGVVVKPKEKLQEYLKKETKNVRRKSIKIGQRRRNRDGDS